MKAQLNKDKVKTKNGANVNKNLSARFGIISFFIANFKPSAKPCNKPQNPTTFGPFRL